MIGCGMGLVVGWDGLSHVFTYIYIFEGYYQRKLGRQFWCTRKSKGIILYLEYQSVQNVCPVVRIGFPQNSHHEYLDIYFKVFFDIKIFLLINVIYIKGPSGQIRLTRKWHLAKVLVLNTRRPPKH
jgi:hypothetical protein